MTLVATKITPFPHIHKVNNSNTAFTFDAIATNSDTLALVFQIPKTGTISNIHYRVVGVTSPVMTHRCELRTVDAATGLPNAAGTLYGSSSSITVDASTYSANTNYNAAVNASTATAGDVAAIVFDLSAFTSGSFTQMQQVSAFLGDAGGAASERAASLPYTVTGNSPSAPTKNTNGYPLQCAVLEYSTGEFVPIVGINSWVGASTGHTIETPGTVRAGNYFIPRTKRRAVGMYCECSFQAIIYLRLRLASDDSVLATCTLDPDIAATGNASTIYAVFDAGATVTLTVGTAYYLTIEARDATGMTVPYLGSGLSLAMLDVCPGGQDCYGVTHNGTSYTSYTSANAVRRYGIGLLTDQEDDGTGLGRASLSIGV